MILIQELWVVKVSLFTTGGNGSTATALTLGSYQSATFAGTISSGAIRTSNILTVDYTAPIIRLKPDTGAFFQLRANESPARLEVGHSSNKNLHLSNTGNATFNFDLNVVSNFKINGTTVIDSSRNLTNIGTITNTGRHLIQSGNLQMDNGNNSHRYYYVSTGSGGGDFLLGQIEVNDGVDGAIEGTVCFAYDYGTTSESPKIHFSFAQRNGTARGKLVV